MTTEEASAPRWIYLDPSVLTWKTIAFTLACIIFYRVLQFGSRERGLPPGPNTVPILGNIHLFPQSFPQLKFAEWMKQYGEIFTIKLFNSNMIIVSGPAAIRDVFDHQGALTGGRPQSHMQRAVKGRHMALEDLSHPVWKRGRKAITRFLTSENLNTYLASQKVEYLQMMSDILSDPEDIYNHIRRASASVMTTLVYGKRCLTYHGSAASAFFEGIKLFNDINDPGAYPPIELLPWLAYIPRRLAPWTGPLERATKVRSDLYSGLIEELEEKRRNGSAQPCYLDSVLAEQASLGMSRDEVKFLGCVLMDAGAETATSFLQSFILAILAYPEAQRKAQAEIDALFGDNQLPTLDIFEKLPYLQALINEVHRFRPILPIGLPHIATKTLVYKSYVIPEGSMVVLNAWGLLHDPAYFDEPEVFRPERYLETKFGTKHGVGVEDFRDNLVFGAGRRICPGEEMGRRTIAMNAVNLLWAFDFSPLENPGEFPGMDVFASYAVPGLEMAPKPFRCRIVPRSKARETVIRKEFEACGSFSSA